MKRSRIVKSISIILGLLLLSPAANVYAQTVGQCVNACSYGSSNPSGGGSCTEVEVCYQGGTGGGCVADLGNGYEFSTNPDFCTAAGTPGGGGWYVQSFPISGASFFLILLLGTYAISIYRKRVMVK